MAGAGIDIDNATHRQQLEAAYWEFQHTEQPAWAQVKRAQTATDSARAGTTFFERPADKRGQSIVRGGMAEGWLKRFNDEDAKAKKTAGAGDADAASCRADGRRRLQGPPEGPQRHTTPGPRRRRLHPRTRYQHVRQRAGLAVQRRIRRAGECSIAVHAAPPRHQRRASAGLRLWRSGRLRRRPALLSEVHAWDLTRRGAREPPVLAQLLPTVRSRRRHGRVAVRRPRLDRDDERRDWLGSEPEHLWVGRERPVRRRGAVARRDDGAVGRQAPPPVRSHDLRHEAARGLARHRRPTGVLEERGDELAVRRLARHALGPHGRRHAPAGHQPLREPGRPRRRAPPPPAQHRQAGARERRAEARALRTRSIPCRGRHPPPSRTPAGRS